MATPPVAREGATSVETHTDGEAEHRAGESWRGRAKSAGEEGRARVASPIGRLPRPPGRPNPGARPTQAVAKPPGRTTEWAGRACGRGRAHTRARTGVCCSGAHGPGRCPWPCRARAQGARAQHEKPALSRPRAGEPRPMSTLGAQHKCLGTSTRGWLGRRRPLPAATAPAKHTHRSLAPRAPSATHHARSSHTPLSLSSLTGCVGGTRPYPGRYAGRASVRPAACWRSRAKPLKQPATMSRTRHSASATAGGGPASTTRHGSHSWAIWMDAPAYDCRARIVSPARPMTRPTRARGTRSTDAVGSCEPATMLAGSMVWAGCVCEKDE
jgi:hypothetical protein